MIEKINLKTTEELQTFDVKQAVKDSFVDITKPISQPPIAMGIGYNWKSELNPTFTYGEISAIIAPQKSKKSFFKRALAAAYIGGNTSLNFPDIISKREGDKYVLDFDTEQDKYYSYRAFKGVIDLVGDHYKNYLPYGIKKYSDIEMLQIIDECIQTYRNKIGMVFIDGIADLCFNPNDVVRSNEVINKLKEWTSFGIHICCVIHKTFEKEKAFGHLGTYIQKKCETSIFLSVTDKTVKNSPVKVTQTDSRGAPFDDFYFDLDLETVQPRVCELPKW